MKVAIFNILLFLIISISYGQTVEISGGANMNVFHLPGEDISSLPVFDPEFGYSFGISISDFRIHTLRMRISLLIDNYKGELIRYRDQIGGVTSHISAEVNKTTVGIGLYPINISIRNRFHFSFGGETSIKLYDKTSGSTWSYRLTPSKMIWIKYYEPVRINKNLFFGISGRISYDIRIKENWYISPQYKFYFGLTDEFENFEEKITSRRHCILVGIIRKMK
jgi:hypothetical protein